MSDRVRLAYRRALGVLRSRGLWIGLAALAFVAGWAFTHRYQPTGENLVWDTWGHRYCRARFDGLRCGIAWWGRGAYEAEQRRRAERTAAENERLEIERQAVRDALYNRQFGRYPVEERPAAAAQYRREVAERCRARFSGRTELISDVLTDMYRRRCERDELSRVGLAP